MDPNRAKLAKKIFASILEKVDAASRARYLAEACGVDAELRQEVESLLQAHTQAGDLPQAPGAPPAPQQTAATHQPTP